MSYSSEMPRNEAWIVSVDMGYGHQRAAYPFRDIAFERIITANTDACVSPKERALISCRSFARAGSSPS
jgi:hypothetical protein